MFKNLALNRVIAGALLLAAVFLVVRSFFTPDEFIILLNGLFAGSIVAIAVAYSKLLWYAMLGVGEYNRVRQMTLGIATAWGAICVGVASSIYLRSSGVDVPTTDLTSIARFLAIVAAILQVTAPDFGLGLFHGRDRRVLWTGAVLGLICAAITIYIQQAGQA